MCYSFILPYKKFPNSPCLWLFKCSKTIKKNYFLEKNMYDFYKNFIICSKKIFVSLFKKFNSVKKNHFVKIFIPFKQTRSVKDEFYFQFSFATNEQV